MKKALICILLCVSGCDESVFGPDESTVKCFSGGKIIYDGVATGRVRSSAHGYYFTEAVTGKSIETSAECVITYDSNGGPDSKQ